ncbi:PREDICTED: uncharacterized protein LOC109126280 [Camelina sativa]|uniref:Uncharacterized protein LOC109126280 n=1 Tax=Camelina sativa TaxID=90675 RepID=A0ABM1QEE0_CAMSA|nr:PREDICTED: uncharacterized protein LOC109126280 [Camelina sativa]
MLQLKPTVIEFLKCEVGDGRTASFGFDNWTEFGQLIKFVGAAGPRTLRVREDARVLEATRNGNWALPAARSDNGQTLLVALTATPVPDVTKGPDSYQWRNSTGVFTSSFSSKETWDQVRICSPPVSWSTVVWFKAHIPRFSFVAWLVFLARLPTRDRLRSWGMTVSSDCVLCSGGTESHEHLFFQCPFSSEVWSFFASKFLPQPPDNLHAVADWIFHHQQPHHASMVILLKLLLQSTIYLIWKERNSKIFSSSYSSPASLQVSVNRTLRDRLLSLPALRLSSPSLLLIYFSLFLILCRLVLGN